VEVAFKTAEATGDIFTQGMCTHMKGWLASDARDFEYAVKYLKEAVVLYEAAGHK